MSFTKTTLIGNFIKTIVKTPAVDNDISYDSITLHPPPSDGDGKSIEKIYYIYIYIYKKKFGCSLEVVFELCTKGLMWIMGDGN